MAQVPYLDRWSYYDHRIGPVGRITNSFVAPGWLPDDQLRRLAAYQYLDALNKNSARWWLEASTQAETDDRDKLREYGDAQLFGDRIASGVLGDQIEIMVDGADNEPPVAPPLPPRPEEPVTNDPVDRMAHEATVRVWEQESTKIIEDWEQTWNERGSLLEGQDWLRAWDKAEHFTAKLYELEAEEVVPLGDGVASFQWDSRSLRPTMTLYPPDAYFPVLDQLDDGDFPDKVHLAWGYLDENDDEWVRRITYELVEVGAWRPKYASEGDPPSTHMCYMSDGRWRVEQFEENTIFDLTAQAAEWGETVDGEQIKELPLFIDFIPLIHIPNGFSNLEHFGRSSFAAGVQVLEQIAQADTDAAGASELAGTPQAAVSGTMVPDDLEVRSGTVWQLGDSGRMDVIDQSAALKVLLTYINELQERAERVIRVPAGVLGRDAKNEARSGVALIIENFPYEQEIQKLRLTRESKHRLLLKMVQRIAIQNDAGPSGGVVPAKVAFGSHLPSDLSSTVATVSQLLMAKGLSRASGLRLLVEAGMDLDDAQRELDRIRSEDTEGAVAVQKATGSYEAAARYLGVEAPEKDVIDPDATASDSSEAEPASLEPGPPTP